MRHPSSSADDYVIGRNGSYPATTVTLVDAHLKRLGRDRNRLPAQRHRIDWDIDLLLERRAFLVLVAPEAVSA